MNSLTIPPVCPQSHGQMSVFRGAVDVLFWMVRQVFWAFVFASTLFGAMFALFYSGSALPMVARTLIFHPVIGDFWFDVFDALMVVYLITVAGAAVFSWSKRYPILGKIGWGMFWLMMFLLAVGFTYITWHGGKPGKISPLPYTVSWAKPQDRVLLHLVVPSAKKSLRASKGTVPLWTHTNIVGTATIKTLGHGRYEIRMLQEARSTDKFPAAPK